SSPDRLLRKRGSPSEAMYCDWSSRSACRQRSPDTLGDFPRARYPPGHAGQRLCPQDSSGRRRGFRSHESQTGLPWRGCLSASWQRPPWPCSPDPWKWNIEIEERRAASATDRPSRTNQVPQQPRCSSRSCPSAPRSCPRVTVVVAVVEAVVVPALRVAVAEETASFDAYIP